MGGTSLDASSGGAQAQLTTHEAVSFAGLCFALEGPGSLCADMLRASRVGHESAVSPSAPAELRVACELILLAEGAARRVPARAGTRWEWSGDEGELVTRFGRARVWREARGFGAQVWVSSDPLAAHFMLSGLSSFVLHQAGGAILHAASVELDGGIVAFVGPSGAGKSTACQHVEGARLFSLDRLALTPSGTEDEGVTGGGLWLAHPLPGGTLPNPPIAHSTARELPLRAVLRIHQASEGAWVEPRCAAQAVALLRESAFQTGQRPSAELELLGLLERLASAVPVAGLHLSLGTKLRPLLGRWLASGGKQRNV